MNDTHIRRLTWLLFVGQSLNSAAMIAGTTIGAIVGAALTNQPALAGLPPAAFGLGTALGAYPAARLMERIGRRRGLTVGFVIGIAGAALLTDSLTLGERGRVQGAGDLTIGLIAAVGSPLCRLLFAWGGFAALGAVGIVIGLLPLLLAVRHLALRVSQPELVSG